MTEAQIARMIQSLKDRATKHRKKKAVISSKKKLDRLIAEWQAAYGDFPVDLNNLK